MAASGLLYGYYHFALRNKKFHRYNRFYLLMAVIVSIVIPFLNIPVYFTSQQTDESVMLQTLQIISSPGAVTEMNAVAITTETTSQFSLMDLLYIFYSIAGAILFIRILISFNKIRLLIKNHTIEPFDKIKFVNTDEPGTPFSFFKWLFWNRKIDMHTEKGEQIFRHELFHIQQKHSWDIIFMELVSLIFWINPFFHLMKRELKAIHEFLADEFAIIENKHWQYAELLLMQVLNTNNQLVNPFFHNQIKRRIAMITTSTKPSYRYLRKIMALPIAAVILFLFAFNIKNSKGIDPHEFEKAMNSITVVVDAGHGGTDVGVKTKDGKYTEAQLTLAISKKIEALAHDYNINVIMTREDEKFPGGVSNKNDGLRKRVELTNNANPNAFIAIHIGATAAEEQNARSGFDFYVSKKGDDGEDLELASIIMKELRQVYKVSGIVKQRPDKGIFVLDKSNSPSLLLECGYINNPKDISFISNDSNQEKIARAILHGIVSFANKSTGKVSERSLNGFATDTIKPKENFDNYILVIDGVIQPKRGLKNIDSTIIGNGKSIELKLLKNTGSIAKYGEQGQDGVIEIYTNKVTDEKKVVGYVYQNKNNDKPRPDTMVWIKNPGPPAKRSPTAENLKTWQDTKMYGVWLDGKRIANSELSKYKPADFDLYYASKLEKNAVNYGKHYYQVDLYTPAYYKASYVDRKNSNGFWVKEDHLKDTTKPQKPEPLIAINGKIMTGLELKKLDELISASDIESMTILKDDTAIKKYGEKGKNGVIEIKTKPTVVKEIALAEKEPSDVDNKVFVKVEVAPAFPGGEKEWRKYLEKFLNPEIPKQYDCRSGTFTVVVQFIVKSDGMISSVKAKTKNGLGMEEHVVDLIEKGPKWMPAIQNGYKVSAYLTQPVTFVIGDGNPDMSKSIKYSNEPGLLKEIVVTTAGK